MTPLTPTTTRTPTSATVASVPQLLSPSGGGTGGDGGDGGDALQCSQVAAQVQIPHTVRASVLCALSWPNRQSSTVSLYFALKPLSLSLSLFPSTLPHFHFLFANGSKRRQRREGKRGKQSELSVPTTTTITSISTSTSAIRRTTSIL